MDPISLIYGAVAIGGLITAGFGKKKESAAQKQMTAASIRAENARERQMELEGARRNREIIRQAQLARSTANVNAAGKGAMYGSGLQGGYGQIAQNEARQSNEVEQNLDVGRSIFSANRDYAYASGKSAEGKALYGLGMDIFKSAEPIAKVGTTLFTGKS